MMKGLENQFLYFVVFILDILEIHNEGELQAGVLHSSGENGDDDTVADTVDIGAKILFL